MINLSYLSLHLDFLCYRLHSRNSFQDREYLNFIHHHFTIIRIKYRIDSISKHTTHTVNGSWTLNLDLVWRRGSLVCHEVSSGTMRYHTIISLSHLAYVLSAYCTISSTKNRLRFERNSIDTVRSRSSSYGHDVWQLQCNIMYMLLSSYQLH